MLAAVRARLTLEQLEKYRGMCPNDAAILMLIAANEQIRGRPDRAVESYRSALRFDRRPELYLNLGQALAQMHKRSEAREALLRAAIFAPVMAEEIEDIDLKAEVQRAVVERDAKIRGRE